MYKRIPDTVDNISQFNKLEIMKKVIIKSLIVKNKIDIKTANEWLSDIKQKKYVWEIDEGFEYTESEINNYKSILIVYIQLYRILPMRCSCCSYCCC